MDDSQEPTSDEMTKMFAVGDQIDIDSRQALYELVEALRTDIIRNDGVVPIPSSVLGLYLTEKFGLLGLALLLGEALTQLAQLPVVEKVDLEEHFKLS